MVDIDDQIMSVMHQQDRLSCYEVAQQITDSYGVSYPPKRIRNRLDSLSSHRLLIAAKENRGKGMPTNVYSLPPQSEGSA